MTINVRRVTICQNTSRLIFNNADYSSSTSLLVTGPLGQGFHSSLFIGRLFLLREPDLLLTRATWTALITYAQFLILFFSTGFNCKVFFTPRITEDRNIRFKFDEVADANTTSWLQVLFPAIKRSLITSDKICVAYIYIFKSVSNILRRSTFLIALKEKKQLFLLSP